MLLNHAPGGELAGYSYLLFGLLIALASSHARASAANAHPDPHSYARPWEIRVTHIDLDVVVDFSTQTISGRATLTLKREGHATELVLDTRDLKISKVTVGDDDRPVPFEVGEADPVLGSALRIDVGDQADTVHIDYTTSPDAAALQWLSPEQTTGGKHPFLFSQSQAILARSWVPCQDTPGVRMTYSATVRVPPDLMAVMSASNPQEKNEQGRYTFEMPQPIPSYLMALAVGDLQFESLGPRSGVYAEPEVVESAAWEFADTEQMIAEAEKLYGPYRWDRYDILVLPPSFPFGGMENPRLTFATPTILAGDRSLVALIAHELAHSWSGNLVTNANWNDFWLNEGFTVYFEHRIMEAVYGRDYDDMLARLGKDGLVAEMKTLPDRDTWLQLDLAGRDPDDGMTDVAYEKGYLFLRMIEEAVGREKWDEFLRSYFDQHAFQSMNTGQFLDYLNETIIGDDADLRAALDIDSWVYGPGLPDNCPEIETSALTAVADQAQAFADSIEQLPDTGAWTTHHWLHFLRSLPKPLPTEHLARLDEAFQLTESGNSEIVHDWLVHAIASNYRPADAALQRFLTSQGRRKFLTPLYEELVKTPEGRERALEIYREARPTYHSVSSGTIDEIVDWQSP